MNEQIVNLPNLYVNGLGVSWVSNTALSVALGQCRDSTNTVDLVLGVSTTINSAIKGVNGLDTGILAGSSTYAIYVIGDSRGFKPVGCIMSLSATVPILPSGYDCFRRVGWSITDSTPHILYLEQVGSGLTREYWYDVAVQVLNAGSATSLTVVDLSDVVPPIDCKVFLTIVYTPATVGNVATITTGDSLTVSPEVVSGIVAHVTQVSELTTLSTVVSSIPSIQYIVTASDTLTIDVIGFEDYL